MDQTVLPTSSFWNKKARKALERNGWKAPSQLVRMRSAVQIRPAAPERTLQPQWLQGSFFFLIGWNVVIFLLQALPGMSNGILLSYLTLESMRDVPEEKKATAMGLFQAMYAVGMCMFHAVVGTLAEHINAAVGYALLAAVTLLGMTAALLYYHHTGVEASK